LKWILDRFRWIDALLAKCEEALILMTFGALLAGGVAVLMGHLPWRNAVSTGLLIVGPIVLLLAIICICRSGLAGHSRILLGGVLLTLVGSFLQLTSGVDALLRLLTLMLALLGASLSVRCRAHVAIDVATRFVSTRIRRWVDAVANIGACVVLAALVPHAVGYAADAFAAEEVAFTLGMDGFDVSGALGKGLLALAMFAMSLRFGVLALEVIVEPAAWDARRMPEVDTAT
jgi:TRAP-type C4-dicarboxylate transport system permease small subunit